MAQIFISYASEDEQRAQAIAQALTDRGWSVWWDREIPLGKSYDEVIERALAEAKCVIVLWSRNSIGSKWVKSEASEGDDRDILVPVFLDAVNAPLQFRFLNGANLSQWEQDVPDAEFDKLVGRVTELLGQDAPISSSTAAHTNRTPRGQQTERAITRPSRLSMASLAIGVVVLLVAAGAYVFRGPQQPQPTPAPPQQNGDMEKAISDLTRVFGGAVPATSLARGFHVPDLGVRMAFINQEQSGSSLGALPIGGVVMEVESNGPVAHAGLQTGDVILTIAGKKIESEDELRQAIRKIGPGKSEFSLRRGKDTKKVTVNCPQCKAE